MARYKFTVIDQETGDEVTLEVPGQWATPEEQRMNKPIKCECADPGCPVHPGDSHCIYSPSMVVRRIDIDDGSTTFHMCDRCGEDALDSGVFDTEES